MKQYSLDKLRGQRNVSGAKLLGQYFRPYLGRFMLIGLVLTVSAATGLIIPLLAQHAIDENLGGETADLAGLSQTVMLVIALAIAAATGKYLQIHLTGYLGQKVLFTIRQDLFAHLQKLPLRFFAVNKSGDIIARLTSDVESISRFLNEGLIRMLGTLFSLGCVLIIMFTVQSTLTTIVLIVFAAIMIILALQGQILKTALKNALDLDAKVSNQVQEILNGFRTIKTYGREQEMIESFQGYNRRYFKSAILASFIGSLTQPGLNFMSAGTGLALAILALDLYSQGQFSAGSVLAFIVYIGIFFRPIQNIADLWKNIQDGIASAQRIREILNLKTNITQVHKPYSPELDQIKGKVEFQEVNFGYEGDQLVLHDINFMVKPGKTVALVGPTGGGKTTFVNLIARLYDTTSGQVLVDDENVRSWDMTKLRGAVGYLLQDSILFADTIRNNLMYASPDTDEERLETVLERIEADSFIKKLPKGLDTKIEPGATNISSGQRQLLAIARLILSEPKILILDEATSNIDTKTEKAVQKAINYAMRGVTSFVIAHRLSTIKNADQILLIQNNMILEKGSHKELMDQKGKFYEMYSKFVGESTSN